MTTKGILVQPGVVDSDYQGEIKFMLRELGYCIIPAQTHVAQLFLILYKVPNTQEVARGSTALAVLITNQYSGLPPLI